ncbi:hypothetical protein DASC09_051510 [Saccharomycopsis crataegensis]|uniref:4'-phosphopantetheinyl transferase domain-containing protein n=1 Tax=Saccharomycopsis crataegensis TaxID=43959 RepID=A0AAV5QSY9_9ASCO|nr:hypothetical protein DASC09_051510 [Saccharomycopsis crataegensis]
MSRQVLGLGNDVVNIQRFRNILVHHGINSSYVKRLTQRILNERHEYPRFASLLPKGISGEISGDKIDSSTLHRCCQILAGSWASKEALFKSLDPHHQKHFVFKNWYKWNDENGKPNIQIDRSVAPSDNMTEDQFMLSISHDGDMLIATVLRIGNVELPDR